jgi:hypothetical protein
MRIIAPIVSSSRDRRGVASRAARCAAPLAGAVRVDSMPTMVRPGPRRGPALDQAGAALTPIRWR